MNVVGNLGLGVGQILFVSILLMIGVVMVLSMKDKPWILFAILMLVFGAALFFFGPALLEIIGELQSEF